MIEEGVVKQNDSWSLTMRFDALYFDYSIRTPEIHDIQILCDNLTVNFNRGVLKTNSIELRTHANINDGVFEITDGMTKESLLVILHMLNTSSICYGTQPNLWQRHIFPLVLILGHLLIDTHLCFCRDMSRTCWQCRNIGIRFFSQNSFH